MGVVDGGAEEVLLVAEGEEGRRRSEHVGHLHGVAGSAFFEAREALVDHEFHHLARRQAMVAVCVEDVEDGADEGVFGILGRLGGTLLGWFLLFRGRELWCCCQPA